MVRNENRCWWIALVFLQVFRKWCFGDWLFSIVFYGNNMMLFRHLNQLFNHLSHWIICHIQMISNICHTCFWGCTFICVYLYVLVSCSCLLLCFCCISIWPDVEDGICIWRLICHLRLILPCLLCGCEMYISVHQIIAMMAVFQDMCAFVSVQKKERQTMRRDCISDQICSAALLSCAAQWVSG